MSWAIYLFGNGRLHHTGMGSISMPDVWWPVVCNLVVAPGRSTSRSTLAAQLWPEKDEQAARRCLATAFWRIKARLPKESSPLCLTGDSVSLAPKGRVWIDVLALENRARTALKDPASLSDPGTRSRLRRALSHYSADLLRERDSDLLAIERERLRTLYLDASYELAAAEARAENWAAARDVAQRLCAIEPLREDAQRLLMTAHLHCGGRALAIRQYHQLTALLFKELGVAPMPETIALGDMIGARQINQSAMEHEGAPPVIEGSALKLSMLRVRRDLLHMLDYVDHVLRAER